MQPRPSPERLLQRAKEEERDKAGGKLKIYLGAAPGVGKTYSMLQDALVKRSKGLDVVVGVVESHGRKEIEALLDQFEVIPKQKIDYRGHELLEFNLDDILKRNPGLVLVDELAHTNVRGCRHEKRWQDVYELLDRGIDVWTTLNIQHVESLSDIASQIIHSHINETVPDSVLERAEKIELIDLPPEDLLKRLHEGKVYFPPQARLAADNFFRKGNLIALRQLALRTLAERVGEQVLHYRQGLGIRHIWPSTEKILVCVGPRQQSTKLIRSASRLATVMQAKWVAVHVETPRIQLSDSQRNAAIQNLHLAQELGADTRILSGFDLVNEVMSFAREQNITMIMICKNIRSRWKDILFGSLTDEIVRHSQEIDVYVVTDNEAEPKWVSPVKPVERKIPWKQYVLAIGMVGLATLLNFLLMPYFDLSNIIMVYLLAVTGVALFGRLGLSIFVSVLSVTLFGILFIPQYYSFETARWQNIFTLLVMLVVAQVISHLTIIVKNQAETAKRSEQRTAALHALSKQLASTRGIDKLLHIAVRYIGEAFESEVLAMIPDDQGHLTIREGYESVEVVSQKEQGVVQWVYDLGQLAGLGTDTLPVSDSIYLPLLGTQGAVGVLKIHPKKIGHLFTPREVQLLEACAHQIGIAIEVDKLHEQSKEAEMQLETNRTHNALLKAVSHDMRTPLVAAMGSATLLMEANDKMDAHHIRKIGSTIHAELEQQNRLINNLLQITYLEADEVVLQAEYLSLPDAIEHVIESMSDKLNKKPIHLDIASDLPTIPFDKVLIQEVMVNLLDNAIKFTSPTSPIEIDAYLDGSYVLVSVKDRGPGITPDEVGKLFDKFYRGRLLTTERGLGLGLAICHAIIKAHGGRMWAENRVGGGAAFCFTLPLQRSG